MKQILELKDLVGKTIIQTEIESHELWFKFSDNSFAVMVVSDYSDGFGYIESKVDILDEEKEKINYPLVKLGIITEQEYKEACELDDLKYEKIRLEREEKEKKKNEEYELELLKKLSEKYGK